MTTHAVRCFRRTRAWQVERLFAQRSAGVHGSGGTTDGRVVALSSGQAVFAKNTQAGLLTQGSPPAGTVPQVTGFSGGVVSDDGTKLVFVTVPQTNHAGPCLFVIAIPARLMLRDLGDGSFVVLAIDNGIVARGGVVSNRFAMSPDGTRVAFVSSSSSLVPGDTNGRADLFVRNRIDSTTLLASGTSAGVPAVTTVCCNSFYWNPAFVLNALVAFDTGQPSSLGERGLYSGWDRRVSVRDRSTGMGTLASARTSGVASNGHSTGTLVSRDGTRLVFGSSVRNLVSLRPAVQPGSRQADARQPVVRPHPQRGGGRVHPSSACESPPHWLPARATAIETGAPQRALPSQKRPARPQRPMQRW